MKRVIFYPVDLYDVDTREFMKNPFVTVNHEQTVNAVVAKATSLSNERAEIEFTEDDYLGNGWVLETSIEERTTGKVLVGLSFVQHHEKT